MIGSVLNLPDGPRMLDVVRSGLARAKDVRIAVSFTRRTGLGLLIEPLAECQRKGGRVRVLTSTYQAVTQPEALDILRGLPGVETRVQTGDLAFHSKFWWFGDGGGECWAGSSNLTRGGLVSNLEWNLRRTEPACLADTGAEFDRLWERPDVYPCDDRLLDAYRARYAEIHAKDLPPLANVLTDPADPRRPGPLPSPNTAQREALVGLRDLRALGVRRAAVIAAPGVGKTYLAAFDVLASGAQTALYVSHRLEHLTQAQRSFENVFRGRRSLGMVAAGHPSPDTQIVFATVASLRARPELLARDFDYLVIDEFHHIEAPSYRLLRPLRERAFLLGITATPERQDGREVLEWCDFNVAYEVRLPEAIDRGWLLPFHYFGVADDTLDFKDFRRWSEAQQEARLSIEARVDLVLRHALAYGFDGPKRVTVGFCAGVAHAHFMAEALRKRGHTALAVDGAMEVTDREAIYARLANPADPLEWLFVAGVLNEGVDIPPINSVLFLRPTESSALFIQQLGRGLRRSPGCEVLTVIDFVGNHDRAWVALNALHDPSGLGRRAALTETVAITPPAHCEIVLQEETKAVLRKIARFPAKKEACREAWARLTAELGRSPWPADLWGRADVPDLGTFRAAYGSWLEAARALGAEPSWAHDLAAEHPAIVLLRAVENDWQESKVWAYALVWGLAADPDDPERGFQQFFARWPAWNVERAERPGPKAWARIAEKLGSALEGGRLTAEVRSCLGSDLLPEVEGRLRYTLGKDHRTRHEGVLRSPAELRRFARYDRPEIIRHFGVYFNPAKHNTGVTWLGPARDHAVLICKIDTTTAKVSHQYDNRFLDAEHFAWTSQNKMGPDNEAGARLLEHRARGLHVHLFVQPRSHEPACYVGEVTVREATGAQPIRVVLELERPIPEALRRELEGGE